MDIFQYVNDIVFDEAVNNLATFNHKTKVISLNPHDFNKLSEDCRRLVLFHETAHGTGLISPIASPNVEVEQECDNIAIKWLMEEGWDYQRIYSAVYEFRRETPNMFISAVSYLDELFTSGAVTEKNSRPIIMDAVRSGLGGQEAMDSINQTRRAELDKQINDLVIKAKKQWFWGKPRVEKEALKIVDAFILDVQITPHTDEQIKAIDGFQTKTNTLTIVIGLVTVALAIGTMIWIKRKKS